MVNSKEPNGDIEVSLTDLQVLNHSDKLPFIDRSSEGFVKANEDLRLKYRFLDLRRKELHDRIKLRSKVTQITRSYFHNNGC